MSLHQAMPQTTPYTEEPLLHPGSPLEALPTLPLELLPDHLKGQQALPQASLQLVPQ